MIIKFDHITYVVAENNFDSASKYLKSKGFSIKFQELNKENIGIKHKYLKHNQKHHNLYYFFNDNKIAIEIITYPEHTENIAPFELDFENNLINAYLPNLSTFQVLKGLLSNNSISNNQIDLKGILDKHPVILNNQKSRSQDIAWNLDNLGFCCPTFIVSKAIDFKNKLEAQNIYCSDIEIIEINGNIINIFFVEGYNNEIIEIIAYK